MRERTPLPVTEFAVADCTTDDLVMLVDVLNGLLDREPIRSANGYQPVLKVLGALRSEIRLIADEPDGE